MGLGSIRSSPFTGGPGRFGSESGQRRTGAAASKNKRVGDDQPKHLPGRTGNQVAGGNHGMVRGGSMVIETCRKPVRKASIPTADPS